MIYRISDEATRAVAIRALQGIKINRPYKCTIAPVKKARSNSQNRTYWMWLSIVSNELAGTRADAEQYHDYFREKYLTWENVTMPDLNQRKKLRSTTTLSTKEFSEYMENIRAEMIEFGIALPLPGEQGYDEMAEYYEHITKG